MHLDPEQALALLPRVDLGRTRSGRAVGLRDGAVLALVAVGLSTIEIAALRASDVTMTHRKVLVMVMRNGVPWLTRLPSTLGGRLIVWISEAKIWGLQEPLFRGCRGPLTPMGHLENRRPLPQAPGPGAALPVPGTETTKNRPRESRVKIAPLRRSRVQSRLRELERIEEERSPRCITHPAASSQEKLR